MFFWVKEWVDLSIYQFTYHLPSLSCTGFDSNSVGGEKEVMGIMEKHAYGIRGLPVPDQTVPGMYT